jgi:hypothetical protein
MFKHIAALSPRDRWAVYPNNRPETAPTTRSTERRNPGPITATCGLRPKNAEDYPTLQPISVPIAEAIGEPSA